MASLYVSKYKGGWRVVQEQWTDNKRAQKTVPREAYKALGIDPTWPVEQARKRIKELNASSAVKRGEQRAIVASATRVKKSTNSIWLPEDDVESFKKFLESTNMGSTAHYQKRLEMWETAEKAIAHVNLEPRYYMRHARNFFNFFISRHYSPDYSNKLLGLINQWGYFWSEKRNTHFAPIPYPTHREKDKIVASYRKSPRKCREGGSARLTPKLLETIKKKMKPAHYEWLFISLWFGLRPEEIELAQFTTYTDDIHKVEVLRIFQPKVGTWKFIPILYPEQREALKMLRPLKRPLNKTIQSVLGDKLFTAYSGRKGFESLMRDLGEGIADISSWLGHTSIKTTKKYYENTAKVILSRKTG